MEKDLKPIECIPNFEEINHEIKQIIASSTPLSIRLEKTESNENEYYFKLFQRPSPWFSRKYFQLQMYFL